MMSHDWVPGPHTPERPVSQERSGTPGMHPQPSSSAVSQSLSSPSQISVDGPTSPTHEPHLPRTQVCVPRTHSPTALPHGWVVPSTHSHPSSMIVSQSLSSPSHASVAGPTSPVHVPQEPSTQVCVPLTHSPTSLPQGWVVPSAQPHPSSM